MEHVDGEYSGAIFLFFVRSTEPDWLVGPCPTNPIRADVDNVNPGALRESISTKSRLNHCGHGRVCGA